MVENEDGVVGCYDEMRYRECREGGRGVAG